MTHFALYSTFLLALLVTAMVGERAVAAPCLPPTCACSPGNALPPPAVPAICTVTPVNTATPLAIVTAAPIAPPSGGGGGGDEDPGVQTTPGPRAVASLVVPVPTLIPVATAVLAPVATVMPVASATPLPKVRPAATGNAGLHASDAAMPRNGW